MSKVTQVEQFVVALKTQSKQTAKQCGVSPVVANASARSGLVKVSGTVKQTNSKGDERGRPANVYVLTDKGRRVANKAIKAQAEIEQETVAA